MTTVSAGNGQITADCVVFDIGNVLIEWDPRHLYRKHFAQEEKMEHFLREVCPMEWNLELDRGRSFAEAIEERVALFPEFESEIRAYDTGWHDMVPGEIAGTVALLDELKAARVPLYAITNFSNEKFSEARKRFPFLETSFIDIVISAEERCLKPDRRIYEILFERNELQPSQTVFIDDTLHNVEAARAVGMNAIHFLSAEKLRRDLIAYGLPISPK